MRGTSALLALLAAFVLAGCGGTQVTADEVPGAPPELAIPEADATGAADDTTPSTSTDEDSKDSETSSTSPDETDTDKSSGGGSSSSGSSSGSSGSTGGAAAPSAPQATATPAPQATAAPQPDDAQNDSAPPANSGAERFEDFCAQNPGAC